jgi:hypothetical protein
MHTVTEHTYRIDLCSCRWLLRIVRCRGDHRRHCCGVPLGHCSCISFYGTLVLAILLLPPALLLRRQLWSSCWSVLDALLRPTFTIAHHHLPSSLQSRCTTLNIRQCCGLRLCMCTAAAYATATLVCGRGPGRATYRIAAGILCTFGFGAVTGDEPRHDPLPAGVIASRGATAPGRLAPAPSNLNSPAAAAVAGKAAPTQPCSRQYLPLGHASPATFPGHLLLPEKCYSCSQQRKLRPSRCAGGGPGVRPTCGSCAYRLAAGVLRKKLGPAVRCRSPPEFPFRFIWVVGPRLVNAVSLAYKILTANHVLIMQ